MANFMKDRMSRGEAALGLSVMIPSPPIVEMAGSLGYDWVLIDCEHGSISLEAAENMVRAAEASGTVPIIRPPRNEPDVIGAYMDCGARGIQAPHIHSPKEAQQVVDAVLYGPEGCRSLAVGTRSARYGFASGMERYTQESNQDMLVCVQVEDREGLSQLKDIAAVPRVDVVFIGPSDLSQSLGHPGDPGHPEVSTAMDQAFRDIREMGKLAGTASSLDMAGTRLDQGVSYFYTHLQTLLSVSSQTLFRLR